MNSEPQNLFFDEKSLLSFLDKNEIDYEYHAHPAVYTNEQADLYTSHLDGFSAKNLFLSNHKGNRFFLFVTKSDVKTDLKTLGEQLNESKLRFASEEKMQMFLGIAPGAVTPLAVINDTNRQVQTIFLREAWEADRIFCHPLVNTATLILKHSEIEKFLTITNHEPQII